MLVDCYHHFFKTVLLTETGNNKFFVCTQQNRLTIADGKNFFKDEQRRLLHFIAKISPFEK